MYSEPNMISQAQQSNQESKLDEQFIVYMLEIDGRYKSMTKQDKVRVEQWVSTIPLIKQLQQSKILCHANTSVVWKRNRNLYSMQLLDQVLNNTLQKPFSGPPPGKLRKQANSKNRSLQSEEEDTEINNDFVLPLLSKTQVVSHPQISDIIYSTQVSQ